MANRDSVVYNEPVDPKTGDKILASSTQYLLSVLMITMNERDSVNTIMSDPDNYGSQIKQLNGIKDTTKEKDMQTVKATIAPGQPVYASWINTIINNTRYRDWETDRKSTRLNSSHSGESRMPSSA